MGSGSGIRDVKAQLALGFRAGWREAKPSVAKAAYIGTALGWAALMLFIALKG